MKDLSDKYGYYSNTKEYNENPDKYKGSIVDISMIIRVALIAKNTTPNLY